MFKNLVQQFHFTKAERYGAIALLLLAGFILIWPDIRRAVATPKRTDFSAFANQIVKFRTIENSQKSNPEDAAAGKLFYFDPNTVTEAELIQLGLREKVARIIVKYRSKGGRFRTTDDLQKIYSLTEDDFVRLRPYIRIAGSPEKRLRAAQQTKSLAETFPFNPNTANEADLQRLGLPQNLATRLLRYREKGGRFRQKEDFRKLYGLREEDYARLEPYITLDPEPAQTAIAAAGTSRMLQPSPIDINAADAEAWQTLPGIGPARAHKIVRYRDKLGGFAHTAQVAETYGLPDSVFQAILPLMITATPPYRKISLNTATVEELAAHPYIDFRQARLIVAYREQHGHFTNPADLANIAAFTDPAWLNKVLPYFETRRGAPNVN